MGFMFMQTAPTPGKIIDQASEITDVAWNSINGLITAAIERMPYILAGLLVLAVFYGAARLSKGLFRLATRRTKLDQRLRILFSRLIAIFLTILGIFTAISIIVPSFTFGNIIAGFGLTSVVIGFATKDIINNLLSGVMILWHRPFQIGDYLFSGNHQGKVEYIGVRATSLRKDDGELILIPNGEMYSSALTIRGAGSLRRMNLKFSIGYDSDVVRAKEITKKALDSLDFIVEAPAPKVLVTDLSSDGVNITVNFWINTDKIRPRNAFDVAAVKIMQDLDDEGIELFPPEFIIVQRDDGADESHTEAKKASTSKSAAK
jgi:small-conductance mechanosensitive channel